MLSPVLDRENGDWVFLSWQLSLSCVMGVLAYMVFVWQGSARWGITVALSIVLLVWLIGEAMMFKYISALPQEKEAPEEESEKISKSWLFLRKEYHTLDEDPYESRRRRRIRRSTQQGGQPNGVVVTPIKIDEATSENLTESPETAEALVDDSTKESDATVDDSVETTVIPLSEMQAYLRRLQDESTQGISR